ncbi:hypothetical protein [Phytohabitans kaempferiae]|uniref:Uncharacterized protein n=1 Tax=Phytohabitans kaempferiae TaxID=1620943 RepID=A0ABV6M9R6_9ACTN
MAARVRVAVVGAVSNAVSGALFLPVRTITRSAAARGVPTPVLSTLRLLVAAREELPEV